MKYCLAIDIGASGGRHIVGWRGEGGIETFEVYRFENGMDNADGHLVWDVERLFREVKNGIREAFSKFPIIESLSIDTWGVDYVLMRGDESVLPAYAYRDSRVDRAIEEVHKIISPEEIYKLTGVQHLTFNTIYQLYADKLAGRLEGVTDFLMIPEYLMYRLTGVKKKEFTEASTGAIVNAESGQLDESIFERLGFPKCLIGHLYGPGTYVGELTDEVVREVEGRCKVVFCATHDTGSAVEAIDMDTDSPYISSGTWSLLGVKTEKPLTDEKSMRSGYSNEGGVGYNRYLKNITGMWIIQSLRREMCPDTSYGDIAYMASKSEYRELFNVNDGRFMAPSSMKEAIRGYFSERGIEEPKCDADYFNCAYHSLAEGYRVSIEELESNVGKSYEEIYIVGGGAKNTYLNGLTEKYTKKRVVALPIEATAIGNLKIQLELTEGKI